MKKSFGNFSRAIALFVLMALALVACGSQGSTGIRSGPLTVRVAYFPNLTHAVAIVGVARGTFQSELG